MSHNIYALTGKDSTRLEIIRDRSYIEGGMIFELSGYNLCMDRIVRGTEDIEVEFEGAFVVNYPHVTDADTFPHIRQLRWQEWSRMPEGESIPL